MQINGAVAVVTGGNRGFGRHLVTQLIERGAKVYATARRPQTAEIPGAVPLRLDVSDPDSVSEAAGVATDATLLINNAGISTHTRLIDGDIDEVRREMDTNYYGTLLATRAFAPVIGKNGGGAILNVLSVLSWLHLPDVGGYCVSKAAGWAMTNAVREELAPRGILVSALHVGYMDTDMAAHVEPERKSDPAKIAASALDALAAGSPEIIADELSRQVKQTLSAPVTV